MNAVFSQAFVAPEPRKLPQMPCLPPFYHYMSPQMLSPQTVAASTPSLVARSLTSTPSSSAIAEDDVYRAEYSHTDTLGVADSPSFTFSFDTDENSKPWCTGKTLLPHSSHAVATSSRYLTGSTTIGWSRSLGSLMEKGCLLAMYCVTCFRTGN